MRFMHRNENMFSAAPQAACGTDAASAALSADIVGKTVSVLYYIRAVTVFVLRLILWGADILLRFSRAPCPVLPDPVSA